MASNSFPTSKPQNRLKNDHVLLGDLDISFRRTVRVPDNQQISKLPPDLGKFPLFQVKDYASKMPAEMAAKGGLFMPMYHREAMWIKFKSERRYAIKVYVGAVNAVSGEPAVETAATRLRQRNKMVQSRSVQDYVVVPDQKWLDGIATAVGQVRQFVATPMGSGRSVEAQVTGEDVVGGIQFEITPLQGDASIEPPTSRVFVKYTESGTPVAVGVALSWTVSNLKAAMARELKWEVGENDLIYWGDWKLLKSNDRLGYRGVRNGDILTLVLRGEGRQMEISIKTLTRKTANLIVRSNDTVNEVISKIPAIKEFELGHFPVDKLSLVFDEKQLERRRFLSEYDITQGSTLHLVLRLRGGGGPNEINIAAGGKIQQRIIRDTHRQSKIPSAGGEGSGFPRELEFMWNTPSTTTFNVQILDASSFTRITGLQPPATPVDAAEYARRGLPFFSMPTEPETDVSGDFSQVKSVAQLGGITEPVVNPKIKPLVRGAGDSHKKRRVPGGSPDNGPAPSNNRPRIFKKMLAFLPNRRSSVTPPSAPLPSGTAQPTTTSMDPYTPVDENINADFFNPAGARTSFRSVEDLERELGRMSVVSFD